MTGNQKLANIPRRATNLAALVAAVVAAAVVAVVGLALDVVALSLGGLGAAIVAAGGVALYLIVSERRRHEVAEEELAAQATFLESLVESIGRIAATLDPDEILRRTCREAERLFDARASLLPSDARAPRNGSVVVPLRVREGDIGALLLERQRPFARWDVVRATVLADFAARATENARLVAEAQVREAERSLLSDQLITAEQDERRRLALFLHDGPVQSMSGIGLMLEASLHSIGEDRLDEAKTVLGSALERHRDTIRSLRDLSFNLEPVVLRDQGFGPAVRALADQVGLSHKIQIDLDIDEAEGLAEKAKVALYQIIRDALNLAIRRGPPSTISVRIQSAGDGAVETVIADDGSGERRRATFDEIAERARTINGQLLVEPGPDGGTAVRVVLPPYVARR